MAAVAESMDLRRLRAEASDKWTEPEKYVRMCVSEKGFPAKRVKEQCYAVSPQIYDWRKAEAYGTYRSK